MSKRKTTEQKWHEQSEATKEEAAKLPDGELKEQMLRKASQLHTPLPRSVCGYHRPAYSHPCNEQI